MVNIHKMLIYYFCCRKECSYWCSFWCRNCLLMLVMAIVSICLLVGRFLLCRMLRSIWIIGLVLWNRCFWLRMILSLRNWGIRLRKCWNWRNRWIRFLINILSLLRIRTIKHLISTKWYSRILRYLWGSTSTPGMKSILWWSGEV